MEARKKYKGLEHKLITALKKMTRNERARFLLLYARKRFPKGTK